MTKKKHKGRGRGRAIGTGNRVTPKVIAANRANGSKPKPGKITHDEYEQIQNLKREARGKAFPVLLAKTAEVICEPGRTWGDQAFEAAAHFLADRCGLPKETVQDLKLQAGAVPVV